MASTLTDTVYLAMGADGAVWGAYRCHADARRRDLEMGEAARGVVQAVASEDGYVWRSAEDRDAERAPWLCLDGLGDYGPDGLLEG